MLLLIALLPFLGFLVNAAAGRRLTKSMSGGVACAVMLVSFAASVLAFWRLLGLSPENRVIEQTVYNWISSVDFDARFGLVLDPLSALMILIVTGIGSLIHIYSAAYMHEESDAEFARYFSYLNLFAGFMLLLVLGSNFLVMFVGWEGVGLCSYLLIGFWYAKKPATDAGKKAFIVNRIGDFGFLLGMLMIVAEFGTLDFQQLADTLTRFAPETSFGAVSIIALLLFVGAAGKSAQIPLYVWLPDAMEGPTPVSALIHAATMVTAGVYMIARNSVLFSHAPETLTIIAWVGGATAFFAATIGLVQNDIKRVLAYSTVSQLGYMVLAMGVGAFSSGVFHLYTHAFFKALLFLGAGAVIHALAGEQDIRRMGGLKQALPLSYWTFLIGALAIAGVPGLAGFFSKDEILHETLAAGHPVLFTIALATSLLTAIYMFRLVFLTFHGERAGSDRLRASGASASPAEAERARDPGDPEHLEDLAHSGHLHDAPPAMAFALVVLAIGSVSAGWLALGGRFEHFLHLAAQETPVEHDEGLAATLMVVSSVVALAGIAIAWYLFVRRPDAARSIAERSAGLGGVLVHKYYVDEIYDAVIVQPLRILSEEGLWKWLDVRVVDGAVNGAGMLVARAAAVMRRAQTGSVRAYAASLFLGLVLILGYYLWA
jgi:NADH-quinone oxidoreductase subunit L